MAARSCKSRLPSKARVLTCFFYRRCLNKQEPVASSWMGGASTPFSEYPWQCLLCCECADCMHPLILSGLQIATDDGTAILEGEKSSNWITWSDINPEERDFHIIPKRKKIAEVSIWHVWREQRDGYAITQAWVRDEGMLIEQSDNTWVLRCNSGPNAALTFDDLVVEVNLTPLAKP